MMTMMMLSGTTRINRVVGVVGVVMVMMLMMSSMAMGYRFDPEEHQIQCTAAKPEERHDCGWFGITPDQCVDRFVYGRYCCFDPTPRGAAPQCYHANDSVFTVPISSRRDCGWPGMIELIDERRKSYEVGLHCCWCSSTKQTKKNRH